MIAVRRGIERGRTHLDWLDSRHSFSFGDYSDPTRVHFRALRVINDDRIAPGGGFGTHPHRDMEILTFVLSGELEHRDSMGHGEVLRTGEWQVMSAGTGLRHSEFNPSASVPVHMLQIWLVPDRKGHAPRYAQKAFLAAERSGRWQLTASSDASAGSLPIHRDAHVYAAHFAPDDVAAYEIAAGRAAYLHVATGAVSVDGRSLAAGDALTVEGEARIEVRGAVPAEVLLFDLD